MKSLASAFALLLAVGAPAQEPPAGDGPRGTSQGGAARYDAVGRVIVGAMPGAAVETDSLPDGGFAELTALTTGRTIIVAVVRGSTPPGAIATVSEAAAGALGIDATNGWLVRLRGAVASPQEAAAIRTGGAVPMRADAPAALLTALRHKVDPAPGTAQVRGADRRSTGSSSSARTAVASASRQPGTGFVVHVGAFSTAARAREVATSLGGSILAGPPTWRVRVGPFARQADAAKARTDLARRGYAAAQIIRYP